MKVIFPNRREAGRRLATKLIAYANNPQAIVLGLPRGGVPIAYEIAENLNLPLDVCLVRKLGLPNYPETAMGAISLRHDFPSTENSYLQDYSDNITIIDQNTARIHGVNSEEIKAIATKEQAELKWRDCRYRNCRPMLKIHESIVIVADDGIATGLTMQAAVIALRQQQPEKIIIATTVASVSVVKQLATLADDIICLIKPKALQAVSLWYEDFTQTTDQEVCDLLSQETHQTLSGSV